MDTFPLEDQVYFACTVKKTYNLSCQRLAFSPQGKHERTGLVAWFLRSNASSTRVDKSGEHTPMSSLRRCHPQSKNVRDLVHTIQGCSQLASRALATPPPRPSRLYPLAYVKTDLPTCCCGVARQTICLRDVGVVQLNRHRRGEARRGEASGTTSQTSIPLSTTERLDESPTMIVHISIDKL